jgi:hypothetical protein
MAVKRRDPRTGAQVRARWPEDRHGRRAGAGLRRVSDGVAFTPRVARGAGAVRRVAGAVGLDALARGRCCCSRRVCAPSGAARRRRGSQVGAGVLVGLPLLTVTHGPVLGSRSVSHSARARPSCPWGSPPARGLGRLLWSPPDGLRCCPRLVASVATGGPDSRHRGLVSPRASGWEPPPWRPGAPEGAAGATAPGTCGRPHHRPPRPRRVP